MFNPKQALQRIRRMKHQKQEAQTITQDIQPLFSPPKALPSPTSKPTSTPNPKPFLSKPTSIPDPSPNIEDRVSKLQLMVLRLTDQLTNSSQTVQKLKKQNSNLQTQILKLEYENSQLKAKQVYSSFRRTGSNKKIAEAIAEENDRELFRDKDRDRERDRDGQKLKKPQSQFTSVARQPYSLQVQQLLQDIKNEPLENVLKRREHQFRARKPDQKQLQTGNRYLKELATLQKEYSKSMRKPVLVIKLDDADFQ